MDGREPDQLLTESQRQFAVCNACRYCEDYCAVFPAMELRSAFSEGDLGYLANLCHDCRACYQACMYTEPHEFGLNIPALLGEARVESYARYCRPRWLGRAFEAGPLALGALTLAVLGIMLAAYASFGSLGHLNDVRGGKGSFYEVVPHAAMVVPALLLSGFAVAVAGIGLVAFWRESGGPGRDLLDPRLWVATFSEVGQLRWMQDRGGDCFYPEEERPSPTRRRLHHLVMYGFLLTFAATVSAFIAEYVFDQLPPYSVLSVPVVLGFVGGVIMVWGCVGLLALKFRNADELTTSRAVTMDVTFLLALLAVAVTGLALLALRETEAMGATLIVHLATVAVLYLTAPYGKFVHAVYRFGAVLRSVQERRIEGTQ